MNNKTNAGISSSAFIECLQLSFLFTILQKHLPVTGTFAPSGFSWLKLVEVVHVDTVPERGDDDYDLH